MGRTLLALILFLALPARAQEAEAPKVPLATARANAKANGLVREGDFEAAAKIYRDEALKRPENGILQRNLAGALVRSQQAEEGLAAYSQALRFAETRAEKAATLYDLGNTLALGGQLEQSLQTYMSAMMLAPEDMDIRHNYELVLDMLQQQDQQQQEGESEGDQEGQQEQQPDENQEGQQEEPQDQGQDQQEQESPENPAEQQELQPAELEESEAMDPEDARRLLDAMLEEEKELQAERSKQAQPRNPDVEKDW